MGDGPERHNLEELSKKLNISNRVIFTGSIPQTEVLKRTASCRLAIAPALTEFSPNYIMQSISYHKPFLISKENGLPFDVPESFVFDPRNENELESKITSILKPEKYLSAVEEVKSIDLDYEVTWNDVLSKNFEILKKVLNGSK